MASTYTLSAFDVTFAQNKALLGVYNGSGSGRIVRVYRMWMLNNQVISVTGAITAIELRRITAGSGGTTVTPFKHYSSNESFPAQIVTSTNMSFTPTDILTRFLWSTDEPINSNNPAAAITIDEYEVLPAFTCIWDVGYGDSSVEPITLREGYGLALVNVGATTGQCDVFMEVTLASS